MTTKSTTGAKAPGRPPLYGQAMSTADVQMAQEHFDAVERWMRRRGLGARGFSAAVREMIEFADRKAPKNK